MAGSIFPTRSLAYLGRHPLLPPEARLQLQDTGGPADYTMLNVLALLYSNRPLCAHADCTNWTKGQ